MPWSSFSECWALSQLFHSPLSLLSRGNLVPYFLCHNGGIICISEFIDISPGNLNSSLCFIQASSSHDVLCIQVLFVDIGKGKGLVAKSCPTLATPWTIACQSPLSMGFSRQDHWSGSPFPSPGDLSDLGIEPRSPALQADFLPTEPQGKPQS